MRLCDIKEMSVQDLYDAEHVIEWLFKDLNLDVVWTTHFTDRALGREFNIQKSEVINAFRKMKQKYGARLSYARDKHKEFIAVLKDLATDLNIPFSVDFSHEDPKNHKYKLRGITIMRKDPNKFRMNISGGQELRVEDVHMSSRQDVHLNEGKRLPKTNKGKKKRKFKWKTPEEAHTKLIRTLWYYSNADAT